MKNPYLGQPATILEITKLTQETKLFRVRPDQAPFNFYPGQILEVSLPGFKEAPFAVASLLNKDQSFDLCIRKVGNLTSKLHTLKEKEKIYLRGPLGQGHFSKIPFKKEKSITLIACGIGIIPLRPLIQFLLKENFRKITLYYAAKKEDDLLFKKDLFDWQNRFKILFALEEKPQTLDLSAFLGNITKLLEKTPPLKNSTTVLVGPPIIFEIVPPLLEKLKVDPKNIYLSLERRMDCGLGICQQCAIGPYYVCKDGPVFSYLKIREFLKLF
jgi:NAD(P)H-flavin reductase